MGGFQFRQVLLASLLSSIVLFHSKCEGIKLNSDGGYDIVIGIEWNVQEPANKVEAYLEDIKYGVQAFSAELWKASRQRFHINSVDILIPPNWWTLPDHKTETATWQTLLDSEIRITHEVAAPTAVNPNPCGSSGLHIDLPDTFFKSPRGGQYGSVGKALVNLWARYRFGVWEEHGIPGDTKFPYFHSRPSLTPHWEATGCSNEKITGSFQTMDGEKSDRCDPYGAEMPDDDCRFVPSPTNTANSSLLHFHWLDSVTQFCDSKTHDHVAPNRQNLFCGHHSVWDVIRTTDDYKSTETISESMSLVKFRVLRESRRPQLYILLDRGRTATPVNVLKEVTASLSKLVSVPSIGGVNIAVGTYPHQNQGKDHYYVREEVGWAPIDQSIEDLHRVFANSVNQDGPVVRDFGLAIKEVSEKIKQTDHLAGSVILVVKKGCGSNMFDKISYEQEVIANIKEDNRIKVFAIEAEQGKDSPCTNLQTLVEATSGQYHLINDTMNTERKLEGILQTILDILDQPSIMNSLSSWVTHKQFTAPNEVIDIPIYEMTKQVKVHLTTNRFITASDIILKSLDDDDQTDVQKIERSEWNEHSDSSRRLVFTYILREPKPGSMWTLEHGCKSENPSDCKFFLIVTAQHDNPSPRLGTAIPEQGINLFLGQSIKIDVSSSAEHNYLDMSHQGMKIVPFAIFAKIEMRQQRILGLENVTALVRLGGNHDSHVGTWTVQLKDDGLGQPDVSAHDGIYSGVFTPLEDGLYQISVHASGVSNGNGGGNYQDVRLVNQAGSLLAKDQVNFGCRNSSKPRCESAVPTGSFSRVADMRSTIAVENALTFKAGKPMKIMDFSATPGPNFYIDFGFTSPKLLGSDDSPAEFNIYMAPHVDNFLGSTDMTKLLISNIGSPPGEYISIRFNAGQQAVPYYAVEASYRGQKGGPSNVVGVVPYGDTPIIPVPPTTPTPPPTTPVWPTEETTTRIPISTTTEESEETDPEVTTPAPSTSTTENPEITSSTLSPSTTSDNPSSTSSSTTQSPPSSSDITDPEGSSTSTTQPPETTTPDDDIETSTNSEPSTSTQSPSTTDLTPTTEENNPSTSSTPEPSSSSTEIPTTLSDAPVPSTSTTSTTESPSTSSESPSSTPEIPTTLSEEPTSSSSTTSTTESPITSSEPPSTSSEIPTTQSEEPTPSSSTTSTTEAPSTSSEPPSSTSTEIPTTLSEEPTPSSSTTSTTESPSTSSEIPSTSSEIPSSSSTTEAPSTSSEPPSSTSEIPTTLSEEPIPSSSTTSTTEPPSSTSESPSSTSDIPSTSTTEDPAPPSSSTSPPETTTSELPSSSSTQGTTSSTEASTSITEEASSTSSSTANPTSEQPSSSTPPSTHSTPEENEQTPPQPTTESSAEALKLALSPTLLVVLALSTIFHCQRLLS